MVEGIIQKIFEKFRNKYIGNEELIENISRELEQELIKEIKGIEKTVPNKWQLMIKLIGDNKENE